MSFKTPAWFASTDEVLNPTSALLHLNLMKMIR